MENAKNLEEMPQANPLKKCQDVFNADFAHIALAITVAYSYVIVNVLALMA